MKVPYCLPLINEDVKNEVNDVLDNTGWLTSGPKVVELEKEIKKLTNSSNVICVNSWTSGAMLILRWFGIGKGDEVIIPAYTYSATALACLNVGAKPIMVDVNDDFTINTKEIYNKITNKTKAIIPVDIAGVPCDYSEIYELINKKEIISKFIPNHKNQSKLNRILVVSDAAHSIGAIYNQKPVGSICDITIFSFHSVKNITTGEGGAICLNLEMPFSNDEEYKFLKTFSLNGQTKNAFEKNTIGGWKYDIIAQGLKINMPDICAAIGLAQIKLYNNVLLPERKKIFENYNNFFSSYDWAILPFYKNEIKTSSCHLYMIRIKDISEKQRDEMINILSLKNIGVNVHYIPMTSFTFFKEKGYKSSDFPITYKLYLNEISLPIYNGLTVNQIKYVCNNVVDAYNKIKKNG